MNESLHPSSDAPHILHLTAGQDRFGEHRGLEMSDIDIKVSPQDGNDVLILDNTFRAKGGPPKHLHYDQDEWFYCVEGEFIIEIGETRMRLMPGDAILAPRKVSHVWAHVGESHGKILIAFMPAGKMEHFFRDVMKVHAQPPKDPALWHAHGMELLGPPLTNFADF